MSLGADWGLKGPEWELEWELQWGMTREVKHSEWTQKKEEVEEVTLVDIKILAYQPHLYSASRTVMAVGHVTRVCGSCEGHVIRPRSALPRIHL